MPARDFYAVLGVPRTADADAIKKAYRKLAFELHPDRNPGDEEAARRFKEASEAYQVLSDPDRRARYDRGDDLGLFGASAAREVARRHVARAVLDHLRHVSPVPTTREEGVP